MKTFFITSLHVLISRNILATGILPLLAERESLRVVILCPKKKEIFFRKEFESLGVIIEPLELSYNWRDLFLRYLSLASLKTKSLFLKRRTEMKGCNLLISKILPSFLGRFLVKLLNPLLSSREPFASLCEKYQPALVFATDITNEYDIRLIAEAKRRKIKTVGMVRSWDNLTAKGVIRSVPDELLVNNDIIREEAMKFHGIKSERIKVVGVPHHDRYFSKNLIVKENLLGKFGIKPEDSFVLFAPIGDRYLFNNTVDGYVLKLLDKIIPEKWKILIRLPPADHVKEIEECPFSNRLLIYRPGGNFGSVKNTELSRADDDILIEMLRLAKLIVVGPSTLVIDAAIFDKPVILVGFDGKKNVPYLQSVRRYYDYNHFQPVIESGGASLARSEDEFKRFVGIYLANPAVNRAARRKIVELECQFTDGNSSQRVVEELEKLL